MRTVLAAYAVTGFHGLFGLKQYKLYSLAALERGGEAEVRFPGFQEGAEPCSSWRLEGRTRSLLS